MGNLATADCLTSVDTRDGPGPYFRGRKSSGTVRCFLSQRRNSMNRSNLLFAFTLLATGAFLLCGQPALAQGPHHLQFRVVPGHEAGVRAQAGFDELFLLNSGFAALP